MSDRAARSTAVVCFAVPDESRLFVAGLANRRTVRGSRTHPLPTVSGEFAGWQVLVIHTGVGDSAVAREHLARALAGVTPPPSFVVSAGYAGALHPDLTVGDLVLGENYSAPSLLAAKTHLAGESPHVGHLHTAPDAVEHATAKAALHQTSGAVAVDMETAWIAAACAVVKVPLLSLRVVSDAADQDFPVPGRVLYDAARQRPRYLALPAWLATHPTRIAPFVRFVRGLGPAREKITRALRILLSHL